MIANTENNSIPITFSCTLPIASSLIHPSRKNENSVMNQSALSNQASIFFPTNEKILQGLIYSYVFGGNLDKNILHEINFRRLKYSECKHGIEGKKSSLHYIC